MSDLTKLHCIPCEAGMAPMKAAEIAKYMKDLSLDWTILDSKKIVHQFEFKDFKESIKFVNKVADIANNEGHHPDIYIFYNKVRIELWTHAISSLFKNDFILATKIEKIV